MTRPSLDQYFMSIAREVATRATCDRAHVGAVIVRLNRIITTGYNGSIAGLPHCDDVGHFMINGHCERTVHAEANAICQAAKYGSSVDGCSMYVTHSPCLNCFKLIANSGIWRVVYDKFYRDENVIELAKERGIELVQLGDTENTP
jgi:dCMP deaminase